MAYATLEQLKAELNITHDKQDDLLADKLTDAQAVLELIYKRCFEAPAEEETRYVDYDPAFVKDGRRGLLLPQAWDVCQISQVVNGDGTVITPDKYVTEPRLRNVSGGVITLPPYSSAGGGWPWYALQLKASSGLYWTYEGDTKEAIAITGKFAFSATVPYVVRRATIRLAVWFYQQRDNLTDFQKPKPSKHGIMLLPANLPEDVQGLMKGLRKVHV